MTISSVRLAGLVHALAITGSCTTLLKHTDFGLGIRALAQNRDRGADGGQQRRTSASRLCHLCRHQR
jgi:branched-chain amino acid transport system permease protein